jgi:hypothetical protein
METLLNNINLTAAEKKKTLDDLADWKQKGNVLLFTELSTIYTFLEHLKTDVFAFH